VEHSSTSPRSQARENSVAHDHGETPVVEVAATFDDDRTYPLEVRVSDDGPGIPEQDLAAVRDGDETPLQHGSGLGLWVVQWAVTRLGGEVAFDSSDDAGTTVTVRLPKAHRAEDVGGVRTRELAGDE
jgi:signal transduction histidine kinase